MQHTQTTAVLQENGDIYQTYVHPVKVFTENTLKRISFRAKCDETRSCVIWLNVISLFQTSMCCWSGLGEAINEPMF